MNPQAHAPSAPSSPNPGWHTRQHAAHFDPLLECLIELTRIHGEPWSRESLVAGLPLEDNLLTPSLLPRAAARAGLSARVVQRGLNEIPDRLLPAILLLNDQRALLLLQRLPDGQLQVRFPESGESAESLTLPELEAHYTGFAIFVRPRYRFDSRTPELGQFRGRHWFWSTVYSNWRLYRDALLASLIVNTFALALPLFTLNVYDRVVPNHAIETLWVLAIGVAIALVFDFILRTARAYFIDLASKRIDINLSALIMERVLGIRMAVRPASVGSFAANLRAFEAVRDFIASATITSLIDLPFALIFLLVLAWISPWLVIPPLAGMVLVVLVSLVTQGKIRNLTELSQRAVAQRNATLVESLVGIETIKTMGAEGEMQRRWERATVFLASVGERLKLLSSGTINFAQEAQQIVSVIIIIVGVYLLIEGEMSLGGIIAASMLSGRAMAPLGQIAGLLTQYHNARIALSAIETHMQLPVERPQDSNFLHRSAFRGEIEFRNVTFTYPGAEEPALRRASFHIKAGEKIGVIGRIGSGKTTIEKLVLGLYHPDEGSVLVDGIDTRQIDPAELRRSIGFVPQDALLFYGTLRDNIAMGVPFAEAHQLVNAIEIAGLAEFVNRHPRGFDMLIGERGDSLSGGQKQAISIARAVLNDPPLLLLDEPTSAMDFQSEEQLKGKLRRLVASKTLLLVTHRTSLLELVDRLIVIDQGQIVADGPKAQVVEALQQGRIGKAS